MAGRSRADLGTRVGIFYPWIAAAMIMLTPRTTAPARMAAAMLFLEVISSPRLPGVIQSKSDADGTEANGREQGFVHIGRMPDFSKKSVHIVVP